MEAKQLAKELSKAGGRIGAIRGRMDFHAEYYYSGGGKELTLRIYVSKSSGTYGYQFAACLWYRDPSNPGGGYFNLGGQRTGGCGYEKTSAAADDVLSILAAALEKPYKRIDGAGESSIAPAMLDILGVEYSKDWSNESKKRPSELVHYAHA